MSGPLAEVKETSPISSDATVRAGAKDDAEINTAGKGQAIACSALICVQVLHLN